MGTKYIKKKSILEYGMLTKGHLNLFNNSLSRAKPFNAAVRFLIKYNCHGTQWYVINIISVLRANLLQAEEHKRPIDQVNSEIQMIYHPGMVI